MEEKKKLVRAIPVAAPKKSLRKTIRASTSREQPEMRWPAEISDKATLRANPGMKMMMAERPMRAGFVGSPAAAVRLPRSPAVMAARMMASGAQRGLEETWRTVRKMTMEMIAEAMAL